MILDFERERPIDRFTNACPSRIEQSTVQKSLPDLPAVSLSASKEVGVHVCSGGPSVRSPRHVYDLDFDLGCSRTSTPETEGRCIYFEKRRLPFPSIPFSLFSEKRHHFLYEDSIVEEERGHTYRYVDAPLPLRGSDSSAQGIIFRSLERLRTKKKYQR